MRTRVSKILVAAGLALAAVVGAASPASAALGATIDDISRIGCVITVTFTVEDAGDYAVQVWDDGELLEEIVASVGAGATASVDYTLRGAVMQGASGLGIYVTEPGGSTGDAFDDVDPYNGADSVTTECSESDGTDSGEPYVTPSFDPATVEEGQVTTLTVSRPEDASDEPLEALVLVEGDAVSGVDYQSFVEGEDELGDDEDVIGVVEFGAGESSDSIDILTLAGSDGDREIIVTVIAQEGYQAGESAILVITDATVAPPTEAPPATPVPAPARLTG